MGAEADGAGLLNILQKRLVDLTPQDVEWLVANEIQEGADLEFKQALSTKSGAPDRWVTKGDAIGDDAKFDLVKELVGFANAQGGALVLGIRDSKTKPARAAGLEPIPCVSDLADRLKMACRDLIEPKVHSLEVRGLPMADDGSGVVLFRVNGGSPFAPHRHRGNKECYIRRNDETFPMDMIEIQRQSVELQKRLSHVSDDFARQHSAFLGSSFPAVEQPGFGVYAYAIPLSPFVVPNVHRADIAKPVLTPIGVRLSTGHTSEAILPYRSHLDWRPIVRGTAATKFGYDERFSIVAKEEGSVAIEWVTHRGLDQSGNSKKLVYLGWMTGLFANTLLAVERMRRAAGAMSIEFAVEFVCATTGDLGLADYGHEYYMTPATLPAGSHVFPQYSVGTPETFNSLMQLFETDVLNLVGIDRPGEEAAYDFSGALAAIDRSFASS